MDVRMPDGTIIRGVPEGTSKEEVLKKYEAMQAAQQPAAEPAAPAPEPYKPSYQPSPDEPVRFDTDIFKDVLRQARQGLSFGWWKNPNEERLRAYEPGLATGAEIAGGIVGGGPAAMAAKSVPRMIVLGAGEGALAGAGYAEEGERLSGARKGAMMGGGLAALLPGGAAAVNALRNRLARSPERVAAAEVQRLADQLGLSPEEIIRELRIMGDGAALADLAPQAAGKRIGELAESVPFLERQVLDERMAGRARGALERVEGAVDESLGTQTGRGLQAELKASRQGDPAELYREAFDPANAPALTTGDKRLFTGLKKRPAVQKAERQAKSLAANYGKDWKKMGLAEQMHFTKMALDDQIATAKKPKVMRALIETKKELTGWMDDNLTGYQSAREQFTDSFFSERAIDSGRKALRGRFDANLLDELMETYSGPEANAFRAGVRDEVINQVTSTGRLNKKAIATLRHLFGEDAGDLDPIWRQLQTEGRFAQTEAALAGGGRGALDPTQLTSRAYLGVGLQSPGIVITGAIEEAVKRLRRKSPQAATRAVDLMTKPDLTLSELEEVLSVLGLYSPAAGAAAGAGAVVTPGLLEE